MSRLLIYCGIDGELLPEAKAVVDYEPKSQIIKKLNVPEKSPRFDKKPIFGSIMQVMAVSMTKIHI